MSSQNYVFSPPPPPPPVVNSQIFTPAFNHPFQQQPGYNGLGSTGYHAGHGVSRGRGADFRGSRDGRGRGTMGYSNPIRPFGQFPNATNGYEAHGIPNSAGTRSPMSRYPQSLHVSRPGQQQYLSRATPSSTDQQTNTSNKYGHSDRSSNYSNTSTQGGQGQESGHKTLATGFPTMPFHSALLNQYGDSTGRIDSSKAGLLPVQSFGWQGRSFHKTTSNPCGRGQKRVHSDTFTSTRIGHSRPMDPSAIPSSYGISPFEKPVETPDITPILKKKRRKHNQLGLTPKTEEHESSEEEVIDEESKLASIQSIGSGTGLQQLQFSYNGQLATLRSPSEIAAWIEERKRRFPTKKRAEEAAKRKKELREIERTTREQKNKDTKTNESMNKKHKQSDEALKAKLRAEKLRKQYEKAQQRVEQIEAETRSNHGPIIVDQNELSKLHGHLCEQGVDVKDANRSCLPRPPACSEDRLDTDTLDSLRAGDTLCFENQIDIDLARETPTESQKCLERVPDPSDQKYRLSSQPCAIVSPLEISSAFTEKTLNSAFSVIYDDLPKGPHGDLDFLDDLDDSLSSSTSELSSTVESATSSSGSSAEDEGPTETTARETGVENMFTNKPSRSRAICKAYLAKGRCLRGDKCHYRHELPERGAAKTAASKKGIKGDSRNNGGPKAERLSLYQRMIAQQQEEDDEVMIQHIVFLGENGVLDDR